MVDCWMMMAAQGGNPPAEGNPSQPTILWSLLEEAVSLSALCLPAPCWISLLAGKNFVSFRGLFFLPLTITTGASDVRRC
ncbi:hypothetical protein GDO78_018058 [Eleutherodactylus coqui]|uniref:Uncharacterized protein n=1 Tax=Eleutherodactylus coqui TaxID=57060 RepID=A0A8J6BER7_ELECQ|nr:hypothetical protein GDO78_018058 [Eleutherodactylus coqui]